MTKKERPALTKALRNERSRLLKAIASQEEVVRSAKSLFNAYKWVKSASIDIRLAYYIFRGREVELPTEKDREFRTKNIRISKDILTIIETPIEDAEKNYEIQAGDLQALYNKLEEVRDELRAIYQQ